MRWGIIGTGTIARAFAADLPTSRTGQLVAVASRDVATAEAFGFGARPHGSYDALLADDDVDAVYIATPHPMHAEWAIRAAEAGKHVLCEKPLTMSAAEAVAVFDAAREHDVFAMEAFMYRCHPNTLRFLDLLPTVGEVRSITAVHSFAAPTDRLPPDGRLLSPALGGGAILDVGCYSVSGMRMVRSDPPTDFVADLQLGPTGVDVFATASLRWDDGATAELRCGFHRNEAILRVEGTENTVTLEQPWLPTDGDRGLYAYEADEVADCVARGERQSLRMTWDDSIACMQMLDRWRAT